MVEFLPEAGCGRPIDLGLPKTVGQRGRHTRISKEARTVVRVNQTRIMQGRAKKENKPMVKETVCIGVDVAKNTLDVAVSNSKNIWQFANDHEGITNVGFEINPYPLMAYRQIFQLSHHLGLDDIDSSPPKGMNYLSALYCTIAKHLWNIIPTGQSSWIFFI